MLGVHERAPNVRDGKGQLGCGAAAPAAPHRWADVTDQAAVTRCDSICSIHSDFIPANSTAKSAMEVP